MHRKVGRLRFGVTGRLGATSAFKTWVSSGGKIYLGQKEKEKEKEEKH